MTVQSTVHMSQVFIPASGTSGVSTQHTLCLLSSLPFLPHPTYLLLRAERRQTGLPSLTPHSGQSWLDQSLSHARVLGNMELRWRDRLSTWLEMGCQAEGYKKPSSIYGVAEINEKDTQDSQWPSNSWDQVFLKPSCVSGILRDSPSLHHISPFLLLTYAKSNWFLLITKRLLINKSLWSDLIIYISSWQEIGAMNYSVYELLGQKIKVKRYKMQKIIKSFMRLITRPHV